jgi:hypothetical protein
VGQKIFSVVVSVERMVNNPTWGEFFEGEGSFLDFRKPEKESDLVWREA